jgi:hypothetical protein
MSRMRCGKHGKEIFTSEDAAEAELARIRQLPSGPVKVPTRAYYERRCGWWHLSSRPDLHPGRKP